MPLIELRKAVGSPPQTTMRGQLRTLISLGLIQRRKRDRFPGNVEYSIADAGKALLTVAYRLDEWLETAEQPLALGTSEAKGAIKALVDGWSSSVVRAIAARPLALTELDRLIPEMNYPSLERRLGAMRMAGQIETCQGRSRSRPYTPTTWLRRAVFPVLGAAAWERRFADPEIIRPMGKMDFEAAFLLIAPLLELPRDLAGVCRFAVELPHTKGPTFAGAQIAVEEGHATSCVTRLGGEVTAWVSGSSHEWLHAVLAAELDGLEIGGDYDLARTVLDCIGIRPGPRTALA
jgi:DNA-binding HxlR family transcriptional regulator